MKHLLLAFPNNIIQNQEGGPKIRVGFAINKKQALDIYAHRETDEVVIQIMSIDQYIDEECLEYTNEPIELFPEGATGSLLYSDETVATYKINSGEGIYVFVTYNDVYIVDYENKSGVIPYHEI